MTRALAIVLLLLLAACAANPALREADSLARRGEHEAAWRALRDAAAAAPQDNELRAALQRQRELSLLALATQAENARATANLFDERMLLRSVNVLVFSLVA